MGGINELLLLTCSFQSPFSFLISWPHLSGVEAARMLGHHDVSNMAAMTSATLDSVQKPGLLRTTKFINLRLFLLVLAKC